MRNLLRDSVIYSVAAVISRGLSLLVLPIYTRMLAPADYGTLDLVTVAGSLVVLIVALEIGQALSRFYGEIQGEGERRKMASTALWFAAAAYAGALALAIANARPLSHWLFGSVMETTFRIGAAFIAVNGIFYLILNQLRVELRSISYAILSLVYAFTTIGLGLVLGYVLGFGLNGVLCAQLLAAALSMFIGLGMLRRSYSLCFDATMLKQMLKFSTPLVPSGVATFLTLYANRLLLNKMIGLDAVGLFGVAIRLASIVAILIFGLQVAITPLIYAHYREPETPPRLARIFEAFLPVALAICLALGLFADGILAIFADASYAAAGSLVMALALATLLSQLYVFFPGIAIACKMHLQLLIFVVTGCASLLANWLLIKTFGLAGAVIATLLVSGLFFSMWVLVSQRLYRLPLRLRALALSGLAYTVAACSGIAILHSDLSVALSFVMKLILLMAFIISAFLLGLLHVADLRLTSERIRRALSRNGAVQA